MTRATRSQAVPHSPKSTDANGQGHQIKKIKESKKRKRGALLDNEQDDPRARKLARRAPSPRDEEEMLLEPEHAQAVLEILEEYVATLAPTSLSLADSSNL
jgi:hypothetical protein